jgi:hypothetical protein
MTRFYSIDAANALVPELEAVAGRLRDQRDELVGLRDVYRQRAMSGAPAGAHRPDPDDDADDAGDPELRTIRLRMRGIVDRMQADVAWLDERSIVLRDISTGLLDVPALVAGRQVWLCWRLGEAAVDWWHELESGLAGRRPLADLA